jgi:oligogalacturonide lyase
MGLTTRRDLLLLAAAASGSAQVSSAATVRSFPSELKKLVDPATEFPIYRLTSLDCNSSLPVPASRFIARKSNFLLYSSDRASGKTAIYKLEIKSGENTIIAEGSAIDLRFAALTPDDRGCCYADGESLLVTSLGGGGRPRELYRSPEGWHRSGLPAVTEDGIGALWPEQKDQTFRIRFVSLIKTGAITVSESAESLADLSPRPRRAGFMYRRGKELWLASFDAQHNYRLKIAARPLLSPQWAADGRSILYLSVPDHPALVEIREFIPDTNEDRLIAKTSQFAAFGRNADASVFVGASGSKASPYLFLLVRAVKRELAIAEHKASDPGTVMPVFSPNSQRVFFETDRDGHRCLYSMIVDKLVEETEP